MTPPIDPPSSSPTDPKKVSILFVCLGNICRSPMAEGVFRHLTSFDTPDQHPLIATIDSCGTCAAHLDSAPDPRTRSELSRNGITRYTRGARQICSEDFVKFDYILAMDEMNLDDLREFAREEVEGGRISDRDAAKPRLFGDFGGRTGPSGQGENKNGSKTEIVNDPYYGGQNGFRTVFAQVERMGKGLLEHIEAETEAGAKSDAGTRAAA